jgi:chaperonin GroES
MSDFPLTPLFDRIIIKRSEKEEVSKGGIILAHDKEEAGPAKGVIVAVGPGRRNERNGDVERPPVKVGQIAYFSPFADMEFEIAGEKYQAMNAEDLIGVEAASGVGIDLAAGDDKTVYTCSDCHSEISGVHDCPARAAREAAKRSQKAV